MTTTAYKFLYANYAGLVLAGQDCDGEPEWIGTDSKFQHYKLLVDNYENKNEN